VQGVGDPNGQGSANFLVGGDFSVLQPCILIALDLASQQRRIPLSISNRFYEAPYSLYKSNPCSVSRTALLLFPDDVWTQPIHRRHSHPPPVFPRRVQAQDERKAAREYRQV